jgi:hypothetical protein
LLAHVIPAGLAKDREKPWRLKLNTTKADFDFLVKDIEIQKQVAISAFEEAKRLRAKQKSGEPIQDSDLSSTIDTLLDLAEKLTANTSTTSSLAVNAITVLSQTAKV